MQAKYRFIKGAIFDLDGTLLDSMWVWQGVGRAYLRQRGITARDDLELAVKALSLPQSAAYLQQTYGLSESVEQICKGINGLIEEAYHHSLPLKAGAKGLLAKLAQAQVPMCVATATDRPFVEAALERNGVLSYFADIHTCTEVGAGKDCPLIYEIACKTLQTAKVDTFVFEDALHAIETAKNAGFPVVAVYDASAEVDQPAIIRLADVYLDSLEKWRFPNDV